MEALLLPLLLDRRLARHDAVVARRGRDAHERHARLERRELRDVDRPSAANAQGVVDVLRGQDLLRREHGVPVRVVDQVLLRADLPLLEALEGGLPRDLHRRGVRDEEGVPTDLEIRAHLADLLDRIVTDHHEAGQLHGLRFRETVEVWCAQAIPSEAKPNLLSILKHASPRRSRENSSGEAIAGRHDATQLPLSKGNSDAPARDPPRRLLPIRTVVSNRPAEIH